MSGTLLSHILFIPQCSRVQLLSSLLHEKVFLSRSLETLLLSNSVNILCSYLSNPQPLSQLCSLLLETIFSLSFKNMDLILLYSDNLSSTLPDSFILESSGLTPLVFALFSLHFIPMTANDS